MTIIFEHQGNGQYLANCDLTEQQKLELAEVLREAKEKKILDKQPKKFIFIPGKLINFIT